MGYFMMNTCKNRKKKQHSGRQVQKMTAYGTGRRIFCLPLYRAGLRSVIGKTGWRFSISIPALVRFHCHGLWKQEAMHDSRLTEKPADEQHGSLERRALLRTNGHRAR